MWMGRWWRRIWWLRLMDFIRFVLYFFPFPPFLSPDYDAQIRELNIGKPGRATIPRPRPEAEMERPHRVPLRLLLRPRKAHPRSPPRLRPLVGTTYQFLRLHPRKEQIHRRRRPHRRSRYRKPSLRQRGMGSSRQRTTPQRPVQSKLQSLYLSYHIISCHSKTTRHD